MLRCFAPIVQFSGDVNYMARLAVDEIIRTPKTFSPFDSGRFSYNIARRRSKYQAGFALYFTECVKRLDCMEGLKV